MTNTPPPHSKINRRRFLALVAATGVTAAGAYAIAQAALQVLAQNTNLKRLAELLGWAKKMVRGEGRKSPHGKTEMVGYATHALQPEHMAGFEYAALLSGDGTLQLDWLRRAVDGGTGKAEIRRVRQGCHQVVAQIAARGAMGFID